jgi:NAD(P)-dependent dehydrogenase (short-subunit alcohol dehydrogenase family)
MKLANKVAVVTGGGKGIGKAIALAFAREGASICITGRTLEDLKRTVQEIRDSGGQAILDQGDISNESDVSHFVKITEERFGTINILVNNAAINLPDIPITELTIDQWNYIMAVNLTGPFLCCQKVLPIMYRKKTGSVINISSIGGRQGARFRGAYRASKAALLNLNETMAAESYRYGVRINAICPGSVETDMMEQITMEKTDSKQNWMFPGQIASVAVFLASEESSSITGTAIDAFGQSNPLFH